MRGHLGRHTLENAAGPLVLRQFRQHDLPDVEAVEGGRQQGRVEDISRLVAEQLPVDIAGYPSLMQKRPK